MVGSQTSNIMKLLKNLYACAICQESFTIPNALVNHVKTKHEIVKLTEKEKADWETEVQREFQSCIQCLTKRKQREETKVWTTSSQLNKYKIPRLTRYNSSL